MLRLLFPVRFSGQGCSSKSPCCLTQSSHDDTGSNQPFFDCFVKQRDNGYSSWAKDAGKQTDCPFRKVTVFPCIPGVVVFHWQHRIGSLKDEALCKLARCFTRCDPLLAKEIQDPRLLLMISHMLMMWASNIFISSISVPCISFLCTIGQKISPYVMGKSCGDHVKPLV